ncbi:hypothetical protein ON010_g14574 [Phytophthora cinnamomi]|nr:hypothetical protein ON010_g14574 [Phytophthora cinnamomi]
MESARIVVGTVTMAFATLVARTVAGAELFCNPCRKRIEREGRKNDAVQKSLQNVSRYKPDLVKFKSYKDNVKYISDRVFTMEDLSCITPDDLCRWRNQQAYGGPVPIEEMRSVHRRSSTFEFLEEVTERGNPTRSDAVNKLIKKVKKFEIRRDGAETKVHRSVEFDESINLLQLEHNIPPSNCDETGVEPQGGTPKEAITECGTKEVPIQRGANRENTSVLLSVSATGSLIPPLFYSKGEGLPSDFNYGSPPGSSATELSIDTRVFDEWIGHFLRHIPAARLTLLVLGNHVSHVALPIRRKCLANDIHLLSFPPHTAHILQPLDAGCFRTINDVWRDTIEEWFVDHIEDNLPRHCHRRAVLETLAKQRHRFTGVQSLQNSEQRPRQAMKGEREIANKVLIKLGAKRLLTHEDSSKEIEKKARKSEHAAAKAVDKMENKSEAKIEVERLKLVEAELKAAAKRDAEQRKAEQNEGKAAARLEVQRQKAVGKQRKQDEKRLHDQ